MKKKLLAWLMMLTLPLTCMTACLDDEEWEETEDTGWVDDTEETGGKDDSMQGKQTDSDDSGDSGADSLTGLSISVNQSDGKLKITRSKISSSAVNGDAGVWTVFVYLCGTDLESDNGMGTGDFNEMLDVQNSDSVRFVVQTGGTREWSNGVDGDCIQRYIVQNGDMTLVDEQADVSMAKSSTLADFLNWGAQNYASEHMGLIMWDHGGGSITGVCFDEKADYDSLSLMELNEALGTGIQAFGRKLDFIGFDACLMGTIETANILATYADYMYGSEETEPGSGWDYTVIGDFLAENPDADGADLGKTVCDSFLAACERANDDDLTTLSVIDLSAVDDLLVAFNDFSKGMYEAGQDENMRADIVRAIGKADNFGGNNKSEGYTNMVDLGGILSAGSDYADAQTVLTALNRAIVYSVSGSTHKGASGISIYYPLSIQGSEELSIFEKVCVSPYYLSFVDRQNHSGVTGTAEETYDEEQWFDDAGDWNYGDTETDEEYWDYLDGYEQTGESSYITFALEPGIDEDGYFGFALDDNGINNAWSVSALVYEVAEDGSTALELGETIDVDGDWSTGEFYDYFDGYWLSMPDGQNLALYVVDITDDYVLYTSPILLNDRETNLRMKQYFSDNRVEVEGAWDGIDENGAAAREIVKLKNGDVIVPCYFAFSLEDDDSDEFEYIGDEYVVSGGLDIDYDLMYPGYYQYSFCIDDIYGDYFATDAVLFEIDEDGGVTLCE